VVDLFFF